MDSRDFIQTAETVKTNTDRVVKSSFNRVMVYNIFNRSLLVLDLWKKKAQFNFSHVNQEALNSHPHLQKLETHYVPELLASVNKKN